MFDSDVDYEHDCKDCGGECDCGGDENDCDLCFWCFDEHIDDVE